MPRVPFYVGSATKPRVRDWVLDHISWRGNEQVLDVGCGSGLMLIGAALRVLHGKAVGIDSWKKVDQYGATHANIMRSASMHGVIDRIEVITADARTLPFEDKSFDVVVSSWVIHNITFKNDRACALAEMCRVTKAGGTIAIIDIKRCNEYQIWFEQQGLRVEKYGPRYTFGLKNWLLMVRNQ